MTTIAVMGSAGSGRATVREQILARWAGPPPTIVVLDAAEASALWHDHDDRGTALPDLVILTASGAQGLDGTWGLIWERWAESATPRLIALTHLDDGRVDDDELRLICEAVLGESVVPLTLPLADDDEEIAGTLHLLTLRIRDDLLGETRDPDPEHIAFSSTARAQVEEAVVATTEDAALVERALMGLSMSNDVLAAQVHTLVRSGSLVASLIATTPPAPRPPVGLADLTEFAQALVG